MKSIYIIDPSSLSVQPLDPDTSFTTQLSNVKKIKMVPSCQNIHFGEIAINHGVSSAAVKSESRENVLAGNTPGPGVFIPGFC